ncbi:MAG TPA: PPOX class F420-dependent oxidoreductase [Ktedonobacterales bacterium]|nr:PPOX class F420-dependent oxidoreductase [Ktedonobacterales bacterium]
MERSISGDSGESTASGIWVSLAKARYMSLTTYRATGAPVATPVWFAEAAGTLYVRTFSGAGKVKRIAHTARVTLAACTLSGTVTGPSIEGRARLLTTVSDRVAAERILARKYSVQWWTYFRVLGFIQRLRHAPSLAAAYLAIAPPAP